MGQKEKNNKAIGIDLGTTNSLAAVIINGKPHPIGGKNSVLVPSVLSIIDDDIIVGKHAGDKRVDNPEETVYSVKRMMGKAAADVKNESDKFPFEVTGDKRGLASVKINDKIYSPVELSALILREVKIQAENRLGYEVKRAVITVPAYFDDAQRQATRDAGKIAGLEVMRIINEPTAASLVYGMDKLDRGNIVVYDLGGGTFDISILRVENGIFEVLSTAGDTHLGGDDFDNAIIDYIIKEINALGQNIDTDDPKMLATLKVEAEKAKKNLSSSNSAPFKINIDENNISMIISRENYENMINPLVDRTIAFCQRAIDDAKLDITDIDEVILVGGSTRIPIVVKSVEKFFGKAPHSNFDPDLVVAMGASIQADILTGGRDDLLLLDVTPLSLGMETMGGIMNALIPRNSKIPAAEKEVYTTSVDGQTSVAIRIYQGERELVADNRKLGDFDLTGIGPQKAGGPRIEVTFTLDADGILSVGAKDMKTDKEQDITVRPSYGLTKDEVKEMVRDSFVHARDDIEKRLFIELSQESKTVIAATEKALEIVTEFEPGEKEDIIEAMEDLKEAMNGDSSSILREKFDDLNDATSELAERMVNNSIGGLLHNKTLNEADKLAIKEQS